MSGAEARLRPPTTGDLLAMGRKVRDPCRDPVTRKGAERTQGQMLEDWRPARLEGNAHGRFGPTKP